jgi:hypothetical protein
MSRIGHASSGAALINQHALRTGTRRSRRRIDQVGEFGEEVMWAVDIINGGVALLLALPVDRGRQALYISSTMVSRAAGGCRGDRKTDSAITAEQARMRRA